MSAIAILTKASNLRALNFLKAFGAQKVTDGIKGITDALVSFDPKGATEAQIAIMEQSLDALGQKVAEEQRDYEEATKTLAAAQTLRTQRLTAAEALDAKVNAGDETVKASLERLLGIIEEAEPELESLQKDAAEAKSYVDELRSHYAAAAAKLKGARAALGRAERDMDRAKMQQERAESRAEASAIAAGVHGSGDTLNTALDAMKRRADEAQVAAAAANLKTTTLAPQNHEEDDPHIRDALAAASGAAPKFDKPSDRLAALKNKAA